MLKLQRRSLIISYILLLHLMVAILAVKTDFICKFHTKLCFVSSVRTNEFIQDMLVFHMRMDKNIPDASVIFFGDSIMQSLATGAVTSNTVNYGIGGETSSDLLYALSQYSYSLKQARAIVIAIGINDFFNDIDNGFDQRYAEIITRLPPEKPLILSAIMPAALPKNARFSLDDIVRANARIKSQCAAHARCVFVDIWHVLANQHNQLQRQYFLADGIHLSPDGYQQWIQHLAQAIELATVR